jgi:hypothetical protein
MFGYEVIFREAEQRFLLLFLEKEEDYETSQLFLGKRDFRD